MPLIPRSPQERFEFFRSDLYDSDSGNFSIERTDRQGRLFSQEPLEDLFESVRLLIGARLLRYNDDHGEPPTKMNVKVEITFE